MRSIRPTAISRLRQSLTSEAPVSPLRTRLRPSSCLLCAYRIPPQPTSRRYQSTSQGTASASSASASPITEDARSAPQTHYDFFPSTLPTGPPPKGHFTIDLKALKREFLQLQARAHPDLHPPENKKRAEATSARINEAYKTLQNPLHRAQYLLSLRGVELASDESAKVEDMDLLMAVLDCNERIEEAESEEDLVDVKVANDERIARSVKVLEEAFTRDDLDKATSEAVQLRYWINIKESLDDWEKGEPTVLQH